MRRVAAWITVVAASLALAAGAHERAAVDFRGLSVEEFVASASEKLKARQATTAQVAAESRRRLADTGAAQTAEYATLDQMVRWAGAQLTDQHKGPLRERLAKRDDKPAEWPIAELRAAVGLRTQLGVSGDTDPWIAAWLVGRELSSLTIDDLQWLCAQLMNHHTVGDRVRVVWTGQLRPPRQGLYRFSGSRIYTERETPTGRVRSQLRVSIAGAEVLDTAKTDRMATGRAILLDNTRAASIRVEFVHERPREVLNNAWPGIATLHWEGPNLPRQMIPADVLARNDDSGPGVDATYECIAVDRFDSSEKVLESIKRVEPQIDFCTWRIAPAVFQPHYKQLRMLGDELHRRLTDKEQLTAWIGVIRRAPGRFNLLRPTSELFTSRQRGEVFQAIVEHVDLRLITLANAGRIHETFRPGAERESIDFCGAWLTRGGDYQPAFNANPVGSRPALLTFGEYFGRQNPAGLTYFRDKFVRRDDGGCFLRAAITTAYGYAVLGTVSEWIDWLDERLSDPALVGERRIDWLLARAHAQSVKFNRPEKNWIHPHEQPLEGWWWLEEAARAAQSEASQMRVLKEQATRLFAAKQAERLEALVDEVEATVRSDEAKDQLAEWREALGKLVPAKKGPPKLPSAQVASYLEVLRERETVARERGDHEALARYGQLIARFTPPEPTKAAPRPPAAPPEPVQKKGKAK